MSFSTWVKLFALMTALGVLGFTAGLAWHVIVSPLGGWFEKLIPVSAGGAVIRQDEREVARTMKPSELPKVDPGEPAFRKAKELLAMGSTAEARERFEALINSFPSSSTAPAAKAILSEMNLDDLLSTSRMDGKSIHEVQRGESYLGIAAKQETTLENILHLNSRMDLRGLKPGDRLVVMPLNFRILVEVRQNSLSVWEGGKFLCEFPLRRVPGQIANFKGTTVISSKSAETDGKRIQPGTEGYTAATKSLLLKQPPVRIQAWNGQGEEPSGALLLDASAMEELNLLTRPGNVVEFR